MNRERKKPEPEAPRPKLQLDETERKYFERLPIAMRKKIVDATGLTELMPVDRRRGEASHWTQKRAAKVFVVKTPDGRKHSCTPQEAADFLSCDASWLDEHMRKPLTRFEKSRVYTEENRDGETVVTWADHAVVVRVPADSVKAS